MYLRVFLTLSRGFVHLKVDFMVFWSLKPALRAFRGLSARREELRDHDALGAVRAAAEPRGPPRTRDCAPGSGLAWTNFCKFSTPHAEFCAQFLGKVPKSGLKIGQKLPTQRSAMLLPAMRCADWSRVENASLEMSNAISASFLPSA